MHERRVADDRNDLAEAFFPYSLLHAEGGADARSHTYAGVHRAEGLERCKCVTSYIAGNKDAELRYCIEYAPVRAARAEVWRPHWNLHGLKYRPAFFSGDGAPDDPGIQFSHRGNNVFSLTGDPHRLYMQLNEGI